MLFHETKSATNDKKKRPDLTMLLIMGFFLAQWFLLFRFAGPTWDEAFYYVYARSVIFDQDLSLQNDFILSYETASADFIAKSFHADLTEEGRAANPFAIGSAILWLPWMAIIRLGLEAGQALGFFSGEWLGFEWPFHGGMTILSGLSGLLAFMVAYRIARAETERSSALLATLTLMVATPLLYYQFREPMYSHAMSAFVTTVVVYIWHRQYQSPTDPLQAVVLGASVGLAGLVRWQNVMYLVLPVASIALWWLALPKDEKRGAWKKALLQVVLVGGTAVFVFSLQMSVWRVLYGSWITIPQGDAFMDWRAPFVKQVLFSTFHGLLSWMPVFFLAVAGLIAMGKKKAALVLPMLALLALEIYVNGSTRDWFGAGGFGGRRFTSESAILLVGYAGFLQLWQRKIRFGVGIVIGATLAVYNWTLLRYGLPQKIGGHVVSMYPGFEWVEENYATFLTTMFDRALNLFRRPLEFLLIPNTPLSLIVQEHSLPVKQLVMLVTTAVFIILLWIGGRTIRRWQKKMNLSDYVLPVIVALIVVLANIWIFFRA